MARPGLLKHRKTNRLAFLLQLPLPYAVGLLECMWSTAYENGFAYLGDAVDVELAAQWPGERGQLCKALLEVGFIDQIDGGFEVHDLYDHAPSYVQRRLKRELERREKGLERKHRYASRLRKTTAPWRDAANGFRSPNSGLGGLKANGDMREKEPNEIRQPKSELDDPNPFADDLGTHSQHPAPNSLLPNKSAKKKPKKAAPKKPRERNPLFDAVVEVTGADPSIQRQGSLIGKVVRELSQCESPYTPQDVRRLPAAIKAAGYDFALTVASIPNHIHLVRSKPSGEASDAEREGKNQERLKRLREEQQQAATPSKGLLARTSLGNGRTAP